MTCLHCTGTLMPAVEHSPTSLHTASLRPQLPEPCPCTPATLTLSQVLKPCVSEVTHSGADPSLHPRAWPGRGRQQRGTVIGAENESSLESTASVSLPVSYLTSEVIYRRKTSLSWSRLLNQLRIPFSNVTESTLKVSLQSFLFCLWFWIFIQKIKGKKRTFPIVDTS